MSQIKDTSAINDNLKISIFEVIIFHSFNNIDSHFWPYLTILNHDAREKEKLPTLSKLRKTLEDEQIYLSNENRGTINYPRSSKPKKAKSSEQKEKRSKEKKCNNKADIKKGKRWRNVRHIEENIMKIIGT